MIIMPTPSLSSLTTLGAGGCALAGLHLETREDFRQVPELVRQYGGTPMVLGGGSNILAKDGELPIVLIQPGLGAGGMPEECGELTSGLLNAGSERKVLLKAGAGLALPALLSWCGKHGLSGLEGLVGIPGRVGGAIAMNAGAYGCELAACLWELTLWTPEQGLETRKYGEWSVAYRHFAPEGIFSWYVAVEAVLALNPATPEFVQSRMRENMEKKKAAQPLQERTAGCVFKNPPGASAGKLLDDAGMRGRSEGGMWFSDKHANFLANKGSGTFRQAMELIQEAQEAVAARFGINLELELRIWS